MKKEKETNELPKENIEEIKKEKQSLEEKVSELSVTVEKSENDKLILQNQLKKALADYQNLSNNSEKRNELKFFQMKKSLSESAIPSLDSLTLAIAASKSLNLDDSGKSWLGGIEAIFKSLNKSFEALGLRQFVPQKGDKFDPNIHEAITTVEQGNSGEIYDLVQPGYILDNTVIRPARVVVSK
jgi:molecular chaperone GrpE